MIAPPTCRRATLRHSTPRAGSPSRTIKGGGCGGCRDARRAGVEVVQKVLAKHASAVLPLVPYLDTLRGVHFRGARRHRGHIYARSTMGNGGDDDATSLGWHRSAAHGCGAIAPRRAPVLARASADRRAHGPAAERFRDHGEGQCCPTPDAGSGSAPPSAIAKSLLRGCAFSTGGFGTVRPVVEYTRKFQVRAAEELGLCRKALR